MVFYNGDKVCVRRNGSGSRCLEFGRVQEYVDVEGPRHPTSVQFSNYGDVLSSDDTLFSSCSVSPPPLDSDGGKLLKRVPILSLLSSASAVEKQKKQVSALASLLGEDGGICGPTGLGGTSPIMMKRSKSQSDMIGWMAEAGGKEKKIKKRIIWDNHGRKETEIVDGRDEGTYKILDRKFSVGQTVTDGKTGMQGKVIEEKQYATVHVPFCNPENKNESAHIIPDVDISEIKPISPIFSGVTIEFNGWIGQVTDVQRQIYYQLDDSTYLTRTTQDSVLVRNSRNAPNRTTTSEKAKEQRTIQNQFSYPFMRNSEMPFTGKVERFSNMRLQQLKMEEEADKENNDNSRYATRSKTGTSGASSTFASSGIDVRKRNKNHRENFITAIVESVSIVSIKVRWTGRLPAHLIKVKPAEAEKAKRNSGQDMPPTCIRSAEDVKKVRPLYINPAMYFEKKGLCAYSTDKMLNHEILIPERLWSYELFGESNNIVAPFNLSTVTLSPPPSSSEEKRKDFADDYTGKVKRKRCHDDEATPEESASRRTVIVCKHFTKHFYKVAWEKDTSTREWWCGTELHPLLTQEHKLCLGLIHSHLYVLPRSSFCMYGHCDYGVVVEKPTDNSIVVEWLKIQKDGSVNPVRVLKCEMLDVHKHDAFNELHEGRVVVRSKHAAKYKNARDFVFGTVVAVHRFALGQICVYSASQEKTVELWPHMVELFVGMSLPELIALKVVGSNKKVLRD